MVQTTDIRVDYGDVLAVADVSLEIPAGEVFGLIGPNGAGKTSLIRVLATLLEPTYGHARIAGLDLRERASEVRRLLGYMPDMAPVHDDLTCWEFLDHYGRAHGLGRRERLKRIDACIDRVHLRSKRDVLAGTLSRGMKQRLVLAKTLLHDPKVMLLDEPASGLDPIARIDMRHLLRELARDGRTIIISSHILNELSEFCTSVGVMERGRLVVSGSIEAILASLNRQRRYVVETVGPAEAAGALLGAREGVRDLTVQDGRCEFAFGGDDAAAAAVLADLVRAGVAVRGFYERRRGVEEIMLSVGAREVS